MKKLDVLRSIGLIALFLFIVCVRISAQPGEPPGGDGGGEAVTLKVWVSTTGDDISGDGSVDNPYASPDTAIKYADAGANVILKDGTYYITASIIVSKSLNISSQHGPENCTIDAQGNNSAFYVESLGTEKVSITGLTITGVANGPAVFVYDAGIDIKQCIVYNNAGTAIHVESSLSDTVEVNIIQNIIYNNAGDGLNTPFDDRIKLSVINNTFSQNYNGVNILNANIKLVNNIIAFSKNIGFLDGYENGIDSLEYNLFHNPGGVKDTSFTSVLSIVSDTGNIFEDPQFIDTTSGSGDYRLRITSPAIDAGHPGSPLDADGSPADMGAIPFKYEPIFFNDIVWEGNGLDHHNFVVSDAGINGTALVPGDEIGVFDSYNLVGAVLVKDTMDGVHAPLNIKTSRDNPLTTFTIDGFVPGNEIKFMMYKSSEDKVYEVPVPVYNSGDTIFTSNGLSEVTLDADNYTEQRIPLSKGWNMISFNVMPQGNLNLSDILHYIEPGTFGDTVIMAKDEAGNIVYEAIDDIGQMSLSEGYNVKMVTDTALKLRGTKVDIKAIKLIPGWNIMGYPFRFKALSDSVLYNLMDEGSLVKIQNESGQAIEFLGFPINKWVKGFDVLRPGKGYKINVNNNITSPGDDSIHFDHVVPTDILKSARTTTDIPLSHFVPAYKGNGLDHMNIYIPVTAVTGISISEEDEIAVYDDNVCAGAVKYTPGTELISVRASKDDPTTNEQDGFIEGHEIKIRIWQSANKQEIIDIDEAALGEYPSCFVNSGTGILQIGSSATNVSPDGTISHWLGNAYPNPFDQETTIEFGIERAGRVIITVYNLLGEKIAVIANKNFDAGNHKITWDGKDYTGNNVPNGAYLYRLSTERNTMVKSVCITR